MSYQLYESMTQTIRSPGQVTYPTAYISYVTAADKLNGRHASDTYH